MPTAQIIYLAPARQKIQHFIDAASACAHALLDAARYIEGELPTLALSEGHRAAIAKLCDDFAGTKHDVFSELAELPHKYSFDTKGSILCIDRIVAMLIEDLTAMRAITTALATESLAYALLAESGVTLLNSFVPVRAAAEAYRAAVQAK